MNFSYANPASLGLSLLLTSPYSEGGIRVSCILKDKAAKAPNTLFVIYFRNEIPTFGQPGSHSCHDHFAQLLLLDHDASGHCLFHTSRVSVESRSRSDWIPANLGSSKSFALIPSKDSRLDSAINILPNHRACNLLPYRWLRWLPHLL